jgi:hypothetical protein
MPIYACDQCCFNPILLSLSGNMLTREFVYLFIFWAEVEPSPYMGILYQPWVIDGDDCRATGELND